jgi:DNA-binding CsgD family transcriptional regulator/predicted negative regulator of RcsB-dependent stress response
MTTSMPSHGSAAGLTGRRSESDALDRLLESVRQGSPQALVLLGEPGVGKTALLDCLLEQSADFTVLRAVGIQSEMELPFAGLHQLIAPLVDRVERLPSAQQEALRSALGIGQGPAPERFLVAVAVLSLLSDAAEERPLLIVVDDEQWLDRASAQVFAFVARRIEADPVAVVFAARSRSDELSGLPELAVEGLARADAGALLDAALISPIDSRVRDQLITETGGNPLALLELARGWTPAELAGGFALPLGAPIADSIEMSFQRRIEALPEQTQFLLTLAAAEPTGEPLLVWRAADQLGIPAEAATAAAEGQLLEIGARVRFRHPLVRSAAYRTASLEERQRVHRALADATDREVDPDRRAWHLAQAAPGPDDSVAAELERSASRAQSRGGLAAAAAFLQRSAELTWHGDLRAARLLAAARAKRDAGAFEEALALLIGADSAPTDELRTAEVERLRGEILLEQQQTSEAARLLLSAARRLEPLDGRLARDTHLESLIAATWAGDADIVRAAVRAARAAPPSADTPVIDVLLEAFGIRLMDGYAASVPALNNARELLLAREPDDSAWSDSPWLTAARPGAIVVTELWDLMTWRLLADRLIKVARATGALAPLRFALSRAALASIHEGDLAEAALVIEEDRLVAQAAGNSVIPYTDAVLAAWQGREQEVSELVVTSLAHAEAQGLSRFIDIAGYARAVLHNGLGRYEIAYESTRQAFEHDHLGLGLYVVPELVEAAARTGRVEVADRVFAWLSERTRANPTAWLLGIEARAHALLSEQENPEDHFRESIEQLGTTRLRIEVARSRLLYGEWLRREGRRVDAREQLRLAYEALAAMGAGAFAERARRELLATGETVRKRTAETRGELTAQETYIARLAREGLSNPDIAARLFISPRTVQYHLHKVFTKLQISSRVQLEQALPAATPREEESATSSVR